MLVKLIGSGYETVADPEGSAGRPRVGYVGKVFKAPRPKASTGGLEWGFPSQSTIRSLEERRELPCGVRGGAAAENGFLCVSKFPSVTWIQVRYSKGPLSQRSTITKVQGGLDWIQTIFFF